MMSPNEVQVSRRDSLGRANSSRESTVGCSQLQSVLRLAYLAQASGTHGSTPVQLMSARTPVQISTAPEYESRVPGCWLMVGFPECLLTISNAAALTYSGKRGHKSARWVGSRAPADCCVLRDICGRRAHLLIAVHQSHERPPRQHRLLLATA